MNKLSGSLMNAKLRKYIRTVSMVVMAALLVSCSGTDDFVDLQQFVESVKARPGAQIEAVPVFASYEAFSYGAASFRSPFDVPFVIPMIDGVAVARNVEPDLERVREPLESIALGELTMVGMLDRDRGIIALIRDNQNRVHRVPIGSYLGRNHGKVQAISATQLDVIEIVPSGDGAWVERPQTMTLQP